ncbi:nucleoside-diphosphate-sugarepimerase [Actinobacillus pleuropneumoniae]|uniref:NAD(P)-dependent oxidoreductase n=1 Tax=Actinobacillus pleuropneumoniae TaxID=715 RepID=UPI0001E4A433|nr:NAD(P)H-binding protein [Actinobacillus pleuropneumoniae]EFM89283.1 Predicted nucleoside-diphosphate-sugar epimerase [Actinobacillus pleuropneumoniae serovar 4 str. M62]UKH41734.1 NAD-dependent epimerase/dehydratase family protein [Actinobacillus pleuropneumoniae serovar 4 str. M62]SQF65312.1 nucleoside-diphosphate-sugarepimerase [Actinobacillus pleuropneumoniae]
MILLFGANGLAGRALLEAAEQPIVSVLRRPSDDPFFADRQTAVANVMSPEACEAVIQQYAPKVVISYIGGKKEGVRSDAAGNINIIRAMLKYAPTARFIFITSMGCGEQWEFVSERGKQVLGEALREKTQAENLLRESALNWTILRPCGLNTDEGETFRLIENATEIPKCYMSRNALAKAVLCVLERQDLNHKILSVMQ